MSFGIAQNGPAGTCRPHRLPERISKQKLLAGGWQLVARSCENRFPLRNTPAEHIVFHYSVISIRCRVSAISGGTMPHCTKCGAEVPATAQFCQVCGQPQPASATNPNAVPVQPYPTTGT